MLDLQRREDSRPVLCSRFPPSDPGPQPETLQTLWQNTRLKRCSQRKNVALTEISQFLNLGCAFSSSSSSLESTCERRRMSHSIKQSPAMSTSTVSCPQEQSVSSQKMNQSPRLWAAARRLQDSFLLRKSGVYSQTVSKVCGEVNVVVQKKCWQSIKSLSF